MKETVGLNIDRYSFNLKQFAQYKAKMKQLESKGTITELFVNNGYAFEFKKFRVIGG